MVREDYDILVVEIAVDSAIHDVLQRYPGQSWRVVPLRELIEVVLTGMLTA